MPETEDTYANGEPLPLHKRQINQLKLYADEIKEKDRLISSLKLSNDSLREYKESKVNNIDCSLIKDAIRLLRSLAEGETDYAVEVAGLLETHVLNE